MKERSNVKTKINTKTDGPAGTAKKKLMALTATIDL